MWWLIWKPNKILSIHGLRMTPSTKRLKDIFDIENFIEPLTILAAGGAEII